MQFIDKERLNKTAENKLNDNDNLIEAYERVPGG